MAETGKIVLTIATVVYNDKENIRETIESIVEFKKVNSNIEYLIVDGGSTDDTVDIIKEYILDIDQFVSEKDKGIYDAMNKAAWLARGEYILYINSGDMLMPFDIGVLADTKRDEVFYGNVKLMPDKVVKPYALKLMAYAMPFCHQSAIVKTELVKEFAFNDSFKIAADFDLFQRLYAAKKKFQYIDVLIAGFKGGGVSAVMSKVYVKEYTSIIQKNRINPMWTFSLLKFYRNLLLDKILR